MCDNNNVIIGLFLGADLGGYCDVKPDTNEPPKVEVSWDRGPSPEDAVDQAYEELRARSMELSACVSKYEFLLLERLPADFPARIELEQRIKAYDLASGKHIELCAIQTDQPNTNEEPT